MRRKSEFIYDCPAHFVHFAYHFIGKERDTESGLDYFGARHYSSTMGRWMSSNYTDVLIPVTNLGNPQSLNLYGLLAEQSAKRLG